MHLDLDIDHIVCIYNIHTILSISKSKSIDPCALMNVLGIQPDDEPLAPGQPPETLAREVKSESHEYQDLVSG